MVTKENNKTDVVTYLIKHSLLGRNSDCRAGPTRETCIGEIDVQKQNLRNQAQKIKKAEVILKGNQEQLSELISCSEGLKRTAPPTHTQLLRKVHREIGRVQKEIGKLSEKISIRKEKLDYAKMNYQQVQEKVTMYERELYGRASIDDTPAVEHSSASTIGQG